MRGRSSQDRRRGWSAPPAGAPSGARSGCRRRGGAPTCHVRPGSRWPCAWWAGTHRAGRRAPPRSRGGRPPAAHRPRSAPAGTPLRPGSSAERARIGRERPLGRPRHRQAADPAPRTPTTLTLCQDKVLTYLLPGRYTFHPWPVLLPDPLEDDAIRAAWRRGWRGRHSDDRLDENGRGSRARQHRGMSSSRWAAWGSTSTPCRSGRSLRHVESFGKFLGGSPANVAVAAARLGRRTAVITRTGADPFGEFLHDALQGFGVDDRYVTAGAGPADAGDVLRDLPARRLPAVLLPPPERAGPADPRRRARPRRDPRRRRSSG